MKHFYGYTTDGTIVTSEIHTFGFPHGCNLHNPNCQHELSVRLRNLRADHDPPVVGFVEWDCGCDREDATCPCPGIGASTGYVADGVWVEKPALTLWLDGVEVDPNTFQRPMSKSPGTVVKIKFQVDGIPDGTTAKMYAASGAAIYAAHPDPVQLTFQDGFSQEVTLVAPAQGLTGGLRVGTVDRYVRAAKFYLRGFAI